jgi:hypothetical protein
VKAVIQAKVIRIQENKSKNPEYNKDYPFLVDLLVSDVMEGERVSIPHERVASRVGLEKGEATLEVSFMAGKSYELRFSIVDIVKNKKGQQ